MAGSQSEAISEQTASPIDKQAIATLETGPTPPADSKLTLLTIAPEVRNNIYELVMCEHVGLHSGQGIVGAYKDQQGDECAIPALAQTCRQVRSEILPVSNGTKVAML